MTNRTGYLIIGLLCLAIAGAVALLAYLWYTTPLGPPIVYRALPGDYRQYWGWIGAGFGFAALVVIVELGGIWWELRKTRLSEGATASQRGAESRSTQMG